MSTRKKSAESKQATGANAVKHGFCATKHVPDEIAARADALREALEAIHDPATQDELDAVAELALNKARLEDLERAFHQKQSTDRSHAAEIFERDSSQRFLDDIAAWQANPAVWCEIVGNTCHGAAYFARLWTMIADSLKPGGPGPSAEQARQAVMTKGSRWQVSQMTDEGAWIMTRFVKSALEPKAELDRWIDDSGSPTDRTRAQWYVNQSPERDACRRELAAEANTQIDRWSLSERELRVVYETEKAQAGERFMGVAPNDKAQNTEFRLMLRYLTTARNRVDRLQRRLDHLKNGRMMAAWRAEREAQREARRQERASRGAMYAYEEEKARIERERQAFYAVPELPMPDEDEADEVAAAACFQEVFDALHDLESQAERESDEVSQVVESESVEPRLRSRIEALAAHVGIDLADLTEYDTEEPDDDEIQLSPEEQREFEAWKRRMERTKFDDRGFPIE